MPAIIVPMVWIDGALFQRQCRGRGDRWLTARGQRLRTDYTDADPDL